MIGVAASDVRFRIPVGAAGLMPWKTPGGQLERMAMESGSFDGLLGQSLYVDEKRKGPHLTLKKTQIYG